MSPRLPAPDQPPASSKDFENFTAQLLTWGTRTSGIQTTKSNFRDSGNVQQSQEILLEFYIKDNALCIQLVVNRIKL